MSQQIRTLSAQNLAIFCEQTAMLLRSGILLHDGIKMIADDAPAGAVQNALQTVFQELSGNCSFEDALKAADVFPPFLVHMAAIGTESGSLDSVMESLASYYSRRHSMQEAVKSAVLYPSVLVVMMAAVLVLLAVKVLPVFQTVLQNLGTDLSPAATAIMGAGGFLSRFSWFFAGLLVLLLAAVILMWRTAAGRGLAAKWAAGFRIADSMSLAFLASSMAALLKSGVETDRALELSQPVVAGRRTLEKTETCRRLIAEEMLSFPEALEKSGLFSGVLASILATGYRSGGLDGAMKYVADLCEESFENDLSRKVSLIEPVSVAVLSVLIGVVLISVMIPLLGVMSAIGA